MVKRERAQGGKDGDQVQEERVGVPHKGLRQLRVCMRGGGGMSLDGEAPWHDRRAMGAPRASSHHDVVGGVTGVHGAGLVRGVLPEPPHGLGTSRAEMSECLS